MPGRIGLSPETPSPYLPDPDQRLPGFARAALLKNVNNYRGCNPGNPRKDRPKRDFFQLPYYVGPLWAERGAVMMDAISTLPVGVLPPQGAHCNVNLHVSTYNIHKGFSQFNRRMMIHELRDHLQVLGADIIFLQEVQGLHSRHAARFEDWPDEPQYEFLADQVWPEFAYGRNAVYDHGHHGNAILSRYPIVRAENQDVSHHALERRGMLHCEIELPEMPQRLHCICVRGFRVRHTHVHHGPMWRRLSDHAALSAHLQLA